MENIVQLQYCNSHHCRRMTFYCVVSPFGLISPGTAWFINKHKTISWLNYQQESPRRCRGRASIWGCPQFITPLSVWGLSHSHLISMLWVTRSIWNGIWSWWMCGVTFKTTNRMRNSLLFFHLFFLQTIHRETHTNSTHMAHETKAIFSINNSSQRLIERDAAWARQCQMKTQDNIAHNCYVHFIEEKTFQVAM